MTIDQTPCHIPCGIFEMAERRGFVKPFASAAALAQGVGAR